MKQKIAAFMMGLGLLVGSFGLVSAQQSQGGGKPNVTAGFNINKDNSSNIGGIAGAGQDAGGSLIDVIKNTLNWILGMLSLIVFVLLLWWGFQMVTAAGDDKKFAAGQTILKQAGIGLAFIAASWLIVSMIFWVISGVTS